MDRGRVPETIDVEDDLLNFINFNRKLGIAITT
jgi:hypothetical protein